MVSFPSVSLLIKSSTVSPRRLAVSREEDQAAEARDSGFKAGSGRHAVKAGERGGAGRKP